MFKTTVAILVCNVMAVVISTIRLQGVQIGLDGINFLSDEVFLLQKGFLFSKILV
jgi:hypothetical protein